MKILDSSEKRKWNFLKAEYNDNSILLGPQGKAWAELCPTGPVNIHLIGKKISGAGDVTLRILLKSGEILFSKDIRFSKKSWTEEKMRVDCHGIKGAAKLEIVRGSRSFGRVEVGRVVVQEDAEKELLPAPIKKKDSEDILVREERKRVAVVIPYGIYGGGEVYIKNLLKDVKRDFQVDLLYLAKNKLEEQDLGSTTKHISARSLKRLSAILVSSAYDVIVFYNSRRVYQAISRLRQSGEVRSKIIEIYHSDFRWPDAVASLRSREAVDGLFRISPGLAEDISGIPDGGVKLLPVGINTDLFTRTIHKDFSIKADLNIPDRKVVFGMISRLSPEKNIEYAIELIKDNDKAHLIIVGDGPSGPSLRSLLKDGEIKNVSLVGYRSNVIDYYNIFDALLLTSKIEGTPISILEAMSCGLPIYSTDVGEIRLNFGHLNNFFLLSQDAITDANLLRGRGKGANFYENLRAYVVNNHNSKINSELFFSYLRNLYLSTTLADPDAYTLEGEYI